MWRGGKGGKGGGREGEGGRDEVGRCLCHAVPGSEQLEGDPGRAPLPVLATGLSTVAEHQEQTWT